MCKDVQKRLNKRTFLSAFLILLAIPIVIAIGIIYMNDRKYYIVSLVILILSMLPFALIFEKRKPQARELIVIAVLCTIAIVGRSAFFMIPQFKPVAAIVIIAGVTLGAESGFLVGAMSGFVSNFFFGQGPWTPWQMFCFGIIGFLAGVLFKKGMLPKRKLPLCIFGGISVLVIYGGIINFGSMVMWSAKPSIKALAATYISGIPFDLIHSVSTVIFLFFIADTMIEKIDRIKKKYGLIEP